MINEEYQYYLGIKTVEELYEHFKSEVNRLDFLNELRDFSESVINSQKKYTPNEATILGLMVNMHKVYVVSLDAYTKKRNEEISWLGRMMYEAHITMKYLIKNGANAQKKFRLISYRNRHKFVNEKVLSDKDAIGLRMIYDVRLRNDKFTIEDLNKEFQTNKNGKLHNFGFKGILKDVNGCESNEEYNTLYGFGSDNSHPNWNDILNNCVELRDGFYRPKISFNSIDGFEHIKKTAIMLIYSIMDFQEYFNFKLEVDPRKYSSPLVCLSGMEKSQMIFIPAELIEEIKFVEK